MSDFKARDLEVQESQPEVKPNSGLLMGAGAVMFLGAVILAAVAAIECHTAVTRTRPDVSFLPSLIYGAVLWLWWPVVAQLLWQAGQKYSSILKASAKNILTQFLLGAAIASLHLGMLHQTVRLLVRGWPELEKAGYGGLTFFNFGRASLDFLIYALLWAACAILSMQISAQREAMRSLELKQQLASAHLRALQMQLEPHFLFNTLNAITTLVELGRQKEAVETIAHLNTILKATLTRSMPEKVPLAQELAIIENYLAIEQIRFADRLRVEIKVDPNALDGLVPCFLLQPIVENAICHGIAHCEDEGLIQTSIERAGGLLHLRVRDNGPGINGQSKPGHGIGLKNTADRLSHFYRERYDLRVSEPLAGGFEVSITIPYECVRA
jgi:signal transduction histidine kinase